jgi:hypothetical protein
MPKKKRNFLPKLGSTAGGAAPFTQNFECFPAPKGPEIVGSLKSESGRPKLGDQN